MSFWEIIFLSGIVGSFAVFGVVIAYLSMTSGRKQNSPEDHASSHAGR